MRVVFWSSLVLLAYVYVGYPLVLRLCLLGGGRPTRRDDSLRPTVSLVIAAHNEEAVLLKKLENSLALDYPRNRLEIVVASDGSTDATNAIAAAFAPRGVRLHAIPTRGGKTRALNLTIPETRGEILVLSDANAMYDSDAILRLVRHFADPSVGAVSGDVRLLDAGASHASSEGLYYRYERWLQDAESRLGSIVGADGAMYALRRSLFRPPSDGIVVDDLVISMTVARLGGRVLYEPTAIAFETSTATGADEFSRRVRITAGAIQALRNAAGLPTARQPFLWVSYLSHKLLRWVSPCLLLLFLLSAILLSTMPLYRWALVAQVVFYALAAVRVLVPTRALRLLSVPHYFCLINAAALIGLWKGLRGGQSATWQRAARAPGGVRQ